MMAHREAEMEFLNVATPECFLFAVMTRML